MALYIPQRRLRMLVERAARIFERHREQHFAITTFESTLLPSAQAFMDVYDRLHNFESTREKEMEEGREGIRELHKTIRVWIGPLSRDVPGFDASQLVGDPRMPDHVLGDAKRVVELAETHRETLPYADALIEAIQLALVAAQREWTQGQDALAELQTLRAAAREHALAAQRELLAFRRTLREVLGTAHRDYRLLTPRRANNGEAEAEDDRTLELEAAAEVPAADAATQDETSSEDAA